VPRVPKVSTTNVNPIERRMRKVMREPPSVRLAASVIVTATAVVVAASGTLMRILDHREYKNIWVGMWWAIQTVTTVGYGDVTPADRDGRIVASFVMLEGIAFLAIVTAVITSTFVARAEADRAEVEEAAASRDREERFAKLEAQLDRIEALLQPRSGSSP
jgi:voltage-gated potassium channel Kch